MAKTIEIRWHGRGGQGMVTSAEILAIAAINEGKNARAFPSFGPERRGAPVLAFDRVSDGPIRVRSGVDRPDVVVVADPTLLRVVDVASGLKDGGVLVLNTRKSIAEVRSEFGFDCRLAVVNASAIARQTLGVPITNTTLLGAVVKASDVVKLESLFEPLKHRFGALAPRNIQACQRAYEETVIEER